MVQPATSDVRVVGEQLNVVDATKRPAKPIKSVVVPAESPSPRAAGVTELPYRTRVNYTADDDNVPTSSVSHAPVDHVTTQSRSHDTSGKRPATADSSQHITSGQLINVTSPKPLDAVTRIQIGDHVDRDKHR